MVFSLHVFLWRKVPILGRGSEKQGRPLPDWRSVAYFDPGASVAYSGPGASCAVHELSHPLPGDGAVSYVVEVIKLSSARSTLNASSLETV